MVVICFDALGTLLDISQVNRILERKFPGQGASISNLWRTKQIDYSRLRTMAGEYRRFDLITHDALVATLMECGLNATDSDVDEIMIEYTRCCAFPDALEFLKLNVRPWAVVTNANRELIETMFNNAGLPVADSNLFTSDQVERFKVSPELYELGWSWAQTAGATQKSHVLFVSANQWDAIAATWFGFSTCWINRNGQSAEFLDVKPTYEVSDFNALMTTVGNEL